MGARLLLVTLASCACALGASSLTPPAAHACGDTGCGVPQCANVTIRARPDMSRDIGFWCTYANTATVVQQPANGTLSPPTVVNQQIRFSVHMAADAPRDDSAVLEVTGPEGTTQAQLAIQTIPLSENSAPVCWGDHVSKRTDGSGPVELYLYPNCYDADGDEMVLTGGGPGEHLDSPLSVPAEMSPGGWRYRTAVASGEETETFWATDVLGARSEDAHVQISVGPSVDSLPTCQPGSAYFGGDYLPVYLRPGAIRRFGIYCTDADGDPFVPALSSPPGHGVLAPFVIDPPGATYGGTDHWIDATYVPADASTEPDPFSVTATGDRGSGPSVRMAMVPVEPPMNSGGGCGWGGLSTPPDTPGTVTARCDDMEGDPLTVKVVASPLHGTAGPPVLTPDFYGQTRIDIAYVPEPGYEGYDCIKVVIEDPYGMRTELTFDIDVRKVPRYGFIPPLSPPLAPIVPPGPQPLSLTQLRERARDAAAQVLGTTAIKRVRSGPADVWVPRRVSRRSLLRRGQAPAAYVVCTTGCRVRSEIGVAGRPTQSKVRGAFVMSAWQPKLVSLAVGPTERRSLRARRTARARLKLSIRASGVKPSALLRSLPIAG